MIVSWLVSVTVLMMCHQNVVVMVAIVMATWIELKVTDRCGLVYFERFDCILQVYQLIIGQLACIELIKVHISLIKNNFRVI